MLVSDDTLDCDVSEKRQNLSVPNSLVKLISIILEEGEPSRELSVGLQKVSANLSQLIRFNSVKQKHREGTQKFRHSKNNEPSLPVLIGLMVHARIGKRKLVDRLATEGASISYDLVMNLRRSISNQACMEYQANGFVGPVDLKKNVFTTTAIDNLDHNPSSATAESSFHGTTISVFQHADFHISVFQHADSEFTFIQSQHEQFWKLKANFQYHTQIFSQQFQESRNLQFLLTLINSHGQNSAIREKFNFFFLAVYCQYQNNF